MKKIDLKEQKSKYQLQISSTVYFYPFIQIYIVNVGLKTPYLVIYFSLQF